MLTAETLHKAALLASFSPFKRVNRTGSNCNLFLSLKIYDVIFCSLFFFCRPAYNFILLLFYTLDWAREATKKYQQNKREL